MCRALGKVRIAGKIACEASVCESDSSEWGQGASAGGWGTPF